MSNQINRYAKNNESFGQIIPKHKTKRRFWKRQLTQKEKDKIRKQEEIQKMEDLGYTKEEIYQTLSKPKNI